MNRLPLRFEKEVLEPAGIVYAEDIGLYYRGEFDDLAYYGDNYLHHEIAARGLEAMTKNHDRTIDNRDGEYRDIQLDTHEIYGVFNKDKDFCECIFKAIREVYKDESEGE